ncbi:MAG TPA: methyltransferase domain-containing protein [Methanothermococcus okinawensis]|uniref:Methyltransferase domain-containing protein n=1 Tax=Methanothermococcus okinawensis TaxID=155863 RepID=A0A832ZAI1_9EURY|nr:methyltransferase domain-containing protein [Methanococcaceae archaeon]HIP84175.1 methyltransferase domain-containing protein [Methanothermococcus okinawensis]HIP91814.1 methyltransferase domain-containing protein [Methanothermococcus okinawensis]
MILRLNVPQWHYSMLQDRERLGVFKWAIERSVKYNDVLYDVGTGSGVLAMIAARIARKVYAIELDPITYQYALENIEINRFKNIELIEGDAREYVPEEEVDVVVMEMLDTALITEPQIPVMNAILKKGILKEGGKVIPERVYNTAQVVFSRMDHIYYDEEITSQPLSKEIPYSVIDFHRINREEVSYNLEFKISSEEVKGARIGIRLNTYTQLTGDTVAGSTPMLNPPLVIPLESPRIEDNILKIKLSYRMGGDLESIKIR